MATPYIMPLGFIERTTEDGGTFTLTNPKESVSLRLNTPVAVWRYSPGQLALAKIRGVICAVGSVVKRVCSRSSLPGVGRRPSMMPPFWRNGSPPRATA